MSWDMVRLGDVCVFEGGSQPPKTTFKYSPQEGYIRLIQIQDYRRNDMAVYIPSELARRFCKSDDVMIGRYGPPVFQILRGLEGAYNVALMKAYPKNKNVLDKNFLYYLLQEEKIQNAVTEQSQRSAGQTGVDKDFIENRIVKLPDIYSQHRIVTEIERQLTAVEKAKQAAREQLAAVREFIAAYLREVFEKNEWDTVELGKICTLINGDAYKDSDWSATGTPIIRIQNLNDPLKPFNYWAGTLDNKVVINNGDLLLAWSGTPGTSFGAHIWERGQAVLNQHIFKVVINENVNPMWLKIAINQELDAMIGKAHGAVGLRHVTKKETEKLKIAIPPLVEQQYLVENIKRQTDKVERAITAVQSQLDTITAMPAAILRQAFSGQM